LTDRKTTNNHRYKLFSFIQFLLIVLAGILIGYIGIHLTQYKEAEKEYQSIQSAYELEETRPPELSDQLLAEVEIETEVESQTLQQESIVPISEKQVLTIYSKQSLKQYDHGGLSNINEDYRCWLDIPGTKISYPVVQSRDNQEYLTTTFEKESRSSGAIFIDGNIDDISEVDNIVLHGHNMKDGSMFGSLPSYKDVSYYNAHPLIYIYSEKETRVYQVISVYSMVANTEVLALYQNTFSDEEEKAAFYEEILSSSFYQTREEIAYDKQLLTLSTCTNQNKYRFIVHAQRYQ